MSNESVLFCPVAPELKGRALAYAAFSRALDGWATLILVALGLASNALCLIVFLRQRRKSLIYCYLLPLSLWDSLLLVSSLFMYSLPQLLFGLYWDINAGRYIYSVPIWYTVGNMTLVGPLWVVLALTLDRYAALCHPFWHLRHMVDRLVVQRRLLLISALAVLYGLPRFWEVTVKTCIVLSANNRSDSLSQPSTKPLLMSAKMAQDPLYQYSYKIVGGLLLYSLAPFTLLLGLTIRISFQLRQAMKDRKTLASGHSQRRLTNDSRISVSKTDRKMAPPSPTKRHEALTADGSRSPSCSRLLSPLPPLIPQPTLSVPSNGVLTPRKSIASFIQQKISKHTPLISGRRNSSQGGDDRTNAMLLCVIVKYLVSHSLPTAIDVLHIFGSEDLVTSEFISYLINISNFFVTLNSACNFWIYFAGSISFRREVQHISGWRRRRTKRRSAAPGVRAEAKSDTPLFTQRHHQALTEVKTSTGNLSNLNLDVVTNGTGIGRSNSCIVTFV